MAQDYVSDIGVLGVLRVISRLRGLILLPIIAQSLGTAYYGAWTQSLLLVALGSSLIDLQLRLAVVRFVSGIDDREEQRSIFLTALAVILVLGSSVALLGFMFPEPIARFVLGNLQFLDLARWLGVWICLAAITQLGLNLIRGLHRVKLYGVLSTSLVFVQLIAVAAAIYLTAGLTMAVMAAIAVEFIFVVVVLGIAVNFLGFGWPDWSYLPKSLAFSLPLVPSYYGNIILSFADRLAIAALLGAEAVGIYAAAYSLAQVMNEIFVPISTALFPAVSRRWDRDDRQSARWLLSNTLRYYLLLAIPALAGMVLLGPELLVILSTELIAAAVVPLLPLLGLGLLLRSLQFIFATVLQLVRDTGALALSRAISATAYIGMILVAVPRLGLFGAAVATFAGYAIDLGITTMMAWRHDQFEIPVVPVAKSIAAASVMASLLMVFELEGLAGLGVGVMLGLATYALIMYLIGGLTRREVKFWKSLIQGKSR